jgi:hypothetical protein
MLSISDTMPDWPDGGFKDPSQYIADSEYFTQHFDYLSHVQNLVQWTGYESDQKDFTTALGYLNKACRLSLNQVDLDLHQLMLTGLGEAKRFNGDVFLEFSKGENSSTHTIQSILLCNRIFKEATLKMAQEGLHIDQAEFDALRLSTCLALLVHDQGEILGELTSLGERLKREGLEENPLLERDIFKFALEVAADAVLCGTKVDFFVTIERVKVEANKIGLQAMTSQDLRTILDSQSNFKSSPSERQQIVEKWLHYYDIVELHDETNAPHRSVFSGYLAKACEHLQGTQHFTRFNTKNKDFYLVDGRPVLRAKHFTEGCLSSLPFEVAPSIRVTGNCKYTEADLDKLIAKSESPFEYALAQVACSCIYRSLSEVISLGPQYVELRVGNIDKRLDRYAVELRGSETEAGASNTQNENKQYEIIDKLKDELLRDQIRLFEEHQDLVREQRENPSDPQGTRTLLAIDTRERIVELYRLAAEEMIACRCDNTAQQNSFSPPSGLLLFEHLTIPEGIKNSLPPLSTPVDC